MWSDLVFQSLLQVAAIILKILITEIEKPTREEGKTKELI